MLQTGYLISNIKSPVWSQRNAPAARDSGWLAPWLWLHRGGYTALPSLSLSQQKTCKYYSGWSGPAWLGRESKVYIMPGETELELLPTLTGQRGGEGNIWAISKSICIFGDIC